MNRVGGADQAGTRVKNMSRDKFRAVYYIDRVHSIDRRSFRSAKDFIDTSLRMNGFVILDGGLSIAEEKGQRRFFQICPSCSSTISTDDTQVASFIHNWGCAECRWKEAEKSAKAEYENEPFKKTV